MSIPFSTSQTSVERKLDKLISDFQQGKRAPSVVSLQTIDSLNPDDKEVWRTIRKELEDIGISVAAFDANKDFIFEWLSNAVDTGAFEEQAVSRPTGPVHSLDVLFSTPSLSSSGVKESSKKTVMNDTESPRASKAKAKPTRNYTIMQERPSCRPGAAEITHVTVIPTKVPGVAALIAFLLQPKRRLEDAMLVSDLDKVKKILKNPANSRLIDKPTLNGALHWAVQVTSKETCALLIDAGADINDHYRLLTPLTEAVSLQDRDLVAFLLDRGADVNHQSGNGKRYSSALRIAIARGDEAMITLLVQRGADINAVQEVPQGTFGYPTGIHQASAGGSASVVDLLINLGADFNSSQIGFGTPLMCSIYIRSVSTAELLIQKGANINEPPVPLGDPKIQFRSIIHIAIYVSSPDLVKLLLENGVVTDWHETYEYAKQRVKERRPQTHVRMMVLPMLRNARRVSKLIKKHKQKSAGQV